MSNNENLNYGFQKKKKEVPLEKAVKRFIKDVKSGSPVDIAVLVVGAVLTIAIIGLCLSMAFAGGSSATTSTPTPSTSASGNNSTSTNTTTSTSDATSSSTNIPEEYQGIVLPAGDDLGSSYLNETLFIGDSNTNRMITYGYTSLANCIGIDGMGVTGITGTSGVYFKELSSPVTIPTAVSYMKPQRIVLTFGTNNTAAWDATTFANSYITAIQAIQKSWPHADIIINAIPPVAKVTNYTSVKISTIDSFNAALLEVATKTGCHFLNSTEVLKGSDGYLNVAYADTDGLHLNTVGLKTLLNYVSTHTYVGEDTRPSSTPSYTHVEAPKPVIDEDPLADDSSSGTTTEGSVKMKYVAGANGKITGASSVDIGGKISVTVTPDNGYHVTSITADYGTYSVSLPYAGGSFQFTNSSQSTGEITITAIFGEHTWTATGDTATCDTAGKKTFTCACGATKEEESPATGVHKEVIKVVTAATCKVEGKSQKVCEDCGKVIEDNIIIPKTDHTWDAGSITTAPSCEAAGTKTYTCTVCGETKTEEIPATGHTWDAGTVTSDPSCGAPGTKTFTCTCGATKTEEIPATGAHNFVDGTCTVCTAKDPNYTAPSSSSETTTPPTDTDTPAT